MNSCNVGAKEILLINTHLCLVPGKSYRCIIVELKLSTRWVSFGACSHFFVAMVTLLKEIFIYANYNATIVSRMIISPFKIPWIKMRKSLLHSSKRWWYFFLFVKARILERTSLVKDMYINCRRIWINFRSFWFVNYFKN